MVLFRQLAMEVVLDANAKRDDDINTRFSLCRLLHGLSGSILNVYSKQNFRTIFSGLCPEFLHILASHEGIVLHGKAKHRPSWHKKRENRSIPS